MRFLSHVPILRKETLRPFLSAVAVCGLGRCIHGSLDFLLLNSVGKKRTTAMYSAIKAEGPTLLQICHDA